MYLQNILTKPLCTESAEVLRGLKVLFENDVARLAIAWLAVVFQILLHHLFRDVARAPRPIANRPEVSPPVAPLQLRVLLLELARGSTFEAFH